MRPLLLLLSDQRALLYLRDSELRALVINEVTTVFFFIFFFASPVFPTLAQPVHVVLDPQDIVLFTTLPRICSWQQSMRQRRRQSSRQMRLEGTAQRFTQTLLTHHQQCSLGGLAQHGALLLVLVRVKRGLRTPLAIRVLCSVLQRFEVKLSLA